MAAAIMLLLMFCERFGMISRAAHRRRAAPREQALPTARNPARSSLGDGFRERQRETDQRAAEGDRGGGVALADQLDLRMAGDPDIDDGENEGERDADRA